MLEGQRPIWRDARQFDVWSRSPCGSDFPAFPLKRNGAQDGHTSQHGAGPNFDCVQRSFCARTCELKIASFWQFRRLVGRPFLVRGLWGSGPSAGLKGGGLFGAGELSSRGAPFGRISHCRASALWAARRTASFSERVTQSSRAGTGVRSLAPAFFVCGEHWRGALCGEGGWFAVGAGEALPGGRCRSAGAGGGRNAGILTRTESTGFAW